MDFFVTFLLTSFDFFTAFLQQCVHMKRLVKRCAATHVFFFFFLHMDNFCCGYAAFFLGMTLAPHVSAGAPGELKLRVV